MQTRADRQPRVDLSAMAHAIDVFVRGYCFTRSLTHPYRAERVGPLWALRDDPRRRGGYRREEWVAHRTTPQEVDRIARAHTRGRYAVCALHSMDEPDEPLRAGYKSLGYRLSGSEPLMMVHPLARIPRTASPARVVRVTNQRLAERLAQANRSRPLRPEHFGAGSPLRQYMALVGDEPVGWSRSVVVGDAAWCADMYVKPEFRRRGIARAMLCRLLRDDRAAGAGSAVLLASHTGAKLYPVVGYRQIGTLLLFTPTKR